MKFLGDENDDEGESILAHLTFADDRSREEVAVAERLFLKARGYDECNLVKLTHVCVKINDLCNAVEV